MVRASRGSRLRVLQPDVVQPDRARYVVIASAAASSLRLALHLCTCRPDYRLHHLLTRSGGRGSRLMVRWSDTGRRLPSNELRRVELDERRRRLRVATSTIVNLIICVERSSNVLCMLDRVDAGQGSLDTTLAARCVIVLRATAYWHNLFNGSPCMAVLVVAACTLKELPAVLGGLLHLAYLQVLGRSELLAVLANHGEHLPV